MIRYTPRVAVACVSLLWIAFQVGCAPSPKQETPDDVAETVKEVKADLKAESADGEPAEPKTKRTWTDTVKDDWGDLGHNLKEDVLGLWSGENLAHNLVVLGGAGALTAVSVNQWDHSVSRYYKEHDALGDWEEVGYELGNPGVHFGVMGLFYAHAKLADNEKSLETSKRLAEALILNGATTLLLKGAVNRTRPNGNDFSFPSGHASSSFATAAVLDGMYGPCVGIPLYLVSGFIAFSRVDAHEHYLSDVIFGAAMGYVFGRTVTKEHERKVLGFEVAPWVDPDVELGGVLLQRRF